MRRTYLLLAALVASLTGCQVQTNVDIETNGAGKGRIAVTAVLDREAAAAVPDLEKELDIDDLRATGWRPSASSPVNGGGYQVSLSHGFDDIDQANSLMAQLTGSNGAFEKFRLTQKKSLTSVRTEFSGTVDLTRGVESFGNDSLAQRFGNRLGFDTKSVQDGNKVDLAAIVPVSISLDAPGSLDKPTPQVAEDGSWKLQYGRVTNLSAVAEGTAYRPLIFMGLTVALLLGAIVIAVVWKSDKYRPQHSGNKGIRARDLLNQEIPLTNDQL